ncbi:J domain-containing protein [Jannaschia helgolandensis]|uniref:DnaJ domain-containing protein n=1 Tax=Jannaschia helgolandensis TaxID=188906 RepID=A0A1H7PE91_9RHOB|nr:J domain-containing protein [Jannaschia helgolandensis]SEL33758.1 DnaJ domain-containing protein [Jannaschia helgolandensis]
MTSKDPFNFDMRVSTAKKRNPRGKRGMSGAVETSTRVCDHDGCEEGGKYRAPKMRDTSEDYFWFCKDHVREYNAKWSFFDGATEAELARQAESDERPTTPFRKTVEERAWARLGIEDAHQVLGGNATRNPGRGVVGRKLPPTERKALTILEGKDDWDKAMIRKAYKSLIKVLHPDINGGDRSQEEQLSEVVWAWDQLKDSRNFK